MWLSGFMWLKVAKSGGCGKVPKSGEKWGKVAKSGKKWLKVVNSGESGEK